MTPLQIASLVGLLIYFAVLLFAVSKDKKTPAFWIIFSPAVLCLFGRCPSPLLRRGGAPARQFLRQISPIQTVWGHFGTTVSLFCSPRF